MLNKKTIGIICGGAALILLTFLFIRLQNQKVIMDEGFHVRQIQQFAAGNFTPDKSLAMGPGYHLAAMLPAKVAGGDLRTIRIINLILNLGAVGIFYLIARRIDRERAILRTALFLVFPLSLPFILMVYTDIFSTGVILVTFYFILRKKYSLAGLSGIYSLIVRQNNIIWYAFLFVLGFVRETEGKRISRDQIIAYLKKTPVFVLGFAVFAVYVFLNRGIALGSEARLFAREGISLNNIYFFMFSNFLFFLPEHISNMPRVLKLLSKKRKLLWIIIPLLFFFYLTIRNDHIWNQQGYLLRNRPLIFFTASNINKFIYFLIIAYTSISLIFITFPGKIYYFLYPVLFLTVLPFNLVEPRYYLVFYTFFLMLKRRTSLYIYFLTFLAWIIFDAWMMMGTINLTFYP